MYAAQVIPERSPGMLVLLGLAAIGGAFAVFGVGCALLDTIGRKARRTQLRPR